MNKKNPIENFVASWKFLQKFFFGGEGKVFVDFPTNEFS
jgi:hypothetical protein